MSELTDETTLPCEGLGHEWTISGCVTCGEVAAKALREAADEWQTGAWADDLPPAGATRPALILGMAQRAAGWLRARADRIDPHAP